MSRRRSLELRFTVWFAGTLMVLYGIVATAVWFASARSARQLTVLTLKNEAETVATYLAIRGELDAPELRAAETEPLPTWLRVTDGSRVLAATPGAPPVAISWGVGAQDAVVATHEPSAGSLLIVRHLVGGRGGRFGADTAVEAIGSLAAVEAAAARLGLGLAALGLVVIPLAVLGGRLLSRRALEPIAGLVADIRGLDLAGAGGRLAVPAGAVEEVAVLAESFNGVLTRLEASAAAMRRFTADASHEIRNPLSVLRTGLEVALRRERSPADYRALLAENLQEIDQLQAVLDGLLALARAEPGQAPELRHDAVDLAQLVAETAARFAAVAAERRIAIELDLAGDLVVPGETQLLRLVIFNLLDNALKHGPPGEPVRVEAGADSELVRLRVGNGGPPIPAAHRPLLFDRYFRGPAAGDPGFGGLGLSVVRWAAEAHGGTVRLLERDQGTCFEVALPRA